MASFEPTAFLLYFSNTYLLAGLSKAESWPPSDGLILTICNITLDVIGIFQGVAGWE